VDRRTAGAADLVLVDSARLRERLVGEGGYPPETVVVMPESSGGAGVDPPPADGTDGVEPVVTAHLALYDRLAGMWAGPTPAKGPGRRPVVRRARREARRAARSDRRGGRGAGR
jgi:hypothetical protein